MLFMIIERFRHGASPVGERFRAQGRLMPPGVTYLASWIEAGGGRCFQLMEAPSRESLAPWIDAWRDLVDFEVASVVPSGRFWQQRARAGDIELRKEPLASEAARALIAATNAELTQRYPEPGATHFRLDADEVAEGRGAFLVAYLEQRPVGCGAIRRLDADSAEIKRMYVAPDARGFGVGRAILRALEQEAGRLGVTRIVLETGERQLEAVGLYASAGYARIPAFGEYTSSLTSVCMAKRL